MSVFFQLEEVMETETYKNAKMILERFDPDSKRKNVSYVFTLYQKSLCLIVFLLSHAFALFFFCKKELESTPVGPQMTPKPGQGNNPF